MDLTQLKYFRVLARLEHATKAAAELHIAQPALSRSLANLEAELKLPLFDRVGRRLRLNENGALLLKHVDAALDELDAARRELLEQRGVIDKRVSLSMYAASKLLPRLIRGFRQRHPDIALQIKQQDNYGETADDCNVKVYSSIRPTSGLNSVTLMEEDICLALPKQNPLAARRSIHLSEAAAEPFICLYKGKGLRRVTDEYCRLAGFLPRIVLESDSPGTVRELIALGVGLAFIPQISWQGMEDDPNVALVEIEEPHCKRCVNMSWQGGRRATQASLLLRSYLVEFFEAALKDYRHKAAV